ncbi:MAG: reverse transcriptase family protein, partial [Cyanobacteriota bacterium]
MEEFPLAREVLELGSIEAEYVPVPVIHKVTATYKQDIEVSDLDLADTIMDKEPTYSGPAPLDPAVIEPHGIDLPTVIYRDAKEAIDLSKYDTHLRPYIEHIFIKRFPQAVSLHALDSGNFSLTMGYTQLRLREGETLPRAKRIFHVSPSDSRHLTDICDFLIKYGYIRKAPVSPTGHHLFGVSSYLIPRAKPGCLGRLIVDFSPINPLLESPPNVIPEVTATLQFLQGKAMFTSLDLRYAFLGLKLDEESRPLTTFLTPTSSYQWLSLPVGCASSPAHFGDVCNKILHFEPERDEKGNPIFESPNVVKLRPDPIKYVTNYVDDILVATPLRKTYEETLKCHFEVLEQVTARLAFHGAKLNVLKCEFAKGKILFLGWYITHDYIVADPRRIEKVKDFPFPESKKAIMAFLGLVNSLRRVVNIEVIRHMNILTPLTSSKTAFCPTER